MHYRTLLFFAAMTACGTGQFIQSPTFRNKDEQKVKELQINAREKSCLNLVNGIETSDYNAVVIIDSESGFCTGTFVSDTTLITAAHCANGSFTGGLTYKRIKPIEIFHYGKIMGSKSRVWEDLLIAVFPPGTSKHFARLSGSPPKPGDRIKLVGFGQTDLVKDNKPDRQKRVGSNRITALQDNNTVIVYESPKDMANLNKGESVMSGRGDSGAPVFNENDQLIGVVSRGSIGEKLIEYDVNLFSAPSLKLMEAAMNRGAVIGGIESVRSSVDPAGGFRGTVAEPKNMTSSSLQQQGQCE